MIRVRYIVMNEDREGQGEFEQVFANKVEQDLYEDNQDKWHADSHLEIIWERTE